jgi:hypothetical protein
MVNKTKIVNSSSVKRRKRRAKEVKEVKGVKDECLAIGICGLWPRKFFRLASLEEASQAPSERRMYRL